MGWEPLPSFRWNGVLGVTQLQALQGHIAASDISHSTSTVWASCLCLCGVNRDTVQVSRVTVIIIIVVIIIETIIIVVITIIITTIIVIIVVLKYYHKSWFVQLCAECRYEVQGEYVIPPDTHIPDSAASMAPMELMGSRSGAPLKPPKSAFGQATGRWRLQVRPQTEHSVPCLPFSVALGSFQQVQHQQWHTATLHTIVIW